MFKISFLLFGFLCHVTFAQKTQCSTIDKYHVVPYQGNWFSAGEYCNSIGMQLATIASDYEQAQIVDVVKSSRIYDNSSNANLLAWIGGSRLSTKSSVIWHPTGTVVNYDNWGGSPPLATDNCVHLWHYPGQRIYWKWKIGNCDVSLYFVCQNTNACDVYGN